MDREAMIRVLFQFPRKSKIMIAVSSSDDRLADNALDGGADIQRLVEKVEISSPSGSEPLL